MEEFAIARESAQPELQTFRGISVHIATAFALTRTINFPNDITLTKALVMLFCHYS